MRVHNMTIEVHDTEAIGLIAYKRDVLLLSISYIPNAAVRWSA